MKISIVIAYHNRRDLFINTLKSISLYEYNSDLEIIVVDDASNNENKINDLGELFPDLDIKIIEVSEHYKWWYNPCIPFNMGFNEVTGDVVIIQNPECLHIGNIIKSVEENIKDNDYLVFGCYAINKEETNKICDLEFNENYLENIVNIITPLQNRRATDEKNSSWYQHSIYRNELLHFCSAMKTKDLIDLGGFDERFANGVAKDDREFIQRIIRKKMNIKTIDNPFVLHQRHEPTSYDKSDLVNINNIVFNKIKYEKTYKVNNKIFKK